MSYAEAVRAAAASIPPLTPDQLAIVATNLKASGPGASSAKTRTRTALEGTGTHSIV